MYTGTPENKQYRQYFNVTVTYFVLNSACLTGVETQWNSDGKHHVRLPLSR